jgi:hypothetical protein
VADVQDAVGKHVAALAENAIESERCVRRTP